jgi:hypothetical protein
MNRKELNRVLKLHRLWVAGDGDGERANLRDANLGYEQLAGMNLSGANLYGANLYGALLFEVNLENADLENADLRDAKLVFANLRGANLRGANLFFAVLHETDLRGVRTNFITRMRARGAKGLTDEQRAQLGMQPAPRAENARRAHSATQLARRLKDQPG